MPDNDLSWNDCVVEFIAGRSGHPAADLSLSATQAKDPEQLLRERANASLSWMQPGLIYPAPFQCALSVFGLPSEMGRAEFADLLSAARCFIHSDHPDCHASACVAFSFATWVRFCEADARRLPRGMEFEQQCDDRGEPQVIERSHGALQNSGAQAWFIVKADTKVAVSAVASFLVERLRAGGVASDDVIEVLMQSRTNPTLPKGGSGGRVLGGRFQENLRNPASPVEILEHVLVGGEDPDCAGGAFVFAQRFSLNWPEIHSKSASEIDSLIGRHQYSDELIASFDARSHVRSSHAYDATGNTIKLLRVGLPFGVRGRNDTATPLVENAGAASRNDEAGIYFIGLARSAARIEAILRSQFGEADGDGFARDRLLGGAIARSDLGGFFYAPSLRELDAKAFADDIVRRRTGGFNDWRRFPGIDWSRLNRHYEKRSPNRLMFYNHQDYLYSAGTRADAGDGLAPLSLRVQFLLERLFSKWDDTWFRSQKPAELAPLRAQLERFFSDPRNASERDALLAEVGVGDKGETPQARVADHIMRQQMTIRAAWANRLLCNLAGRPDGFGQRGSGGMDTCDIHPLDLLAGSMPAQSLAEGRYIIDYTLDNDGEAERFSWFNLALGPNSGVGHVVPGYEELLAHGIDGLNKRIGEAERALAIRDPQRATEAAPFYTGSRIALRGLAEYLDGLAEATRRTAKALAPGQDLERRNLAALEERLSRLAGGAAPATILDALQLVLASHATLHLCGEPVAVGRLDRYVRPFQEKSPLGEAQLQEAIDCFWLKLGEKVLLNRIFIDDRQEQGNLAMGNRAGPYPKGQSVNQWIQQVTVGGRNADGSFECSEATLACLRAAARLPFNAPVLSMRVSRDMPTEWRTRLLEEAARAQLSGGASPILLNDDKIIPALIRSGDGIGPRADAPEAALWNSKVRPDDAYDYACDGCYEPQFVGANWFHLGGITLLQMLELALNQGRQIQSAGPVDLFGKNTSFRSLPATAISSYAQLEEVFLKHLEWSFARQMEGTVADFGRMDGVCPSPLLNLFINDCLSKGRDIYAGGARYNVFGPCFTSLANTINSLWAIRVMCFDQATAITTPAELTQALLCNWGENVIDPLVHSTVLASDTTRSSQLAARFRQLRSIALSLPRWGRGNADLDSFGKNICRLVAELAVRVMVQPRQGLEKQYSRVAKAYGTPAHPFGGFCMQPGVGTFASYVEQGLGCAASADGRLSGQPLGTDMSPAPSPLDLPATEASQQRADGVLALKGIGSSDSFGYANGAPFDLNIDESMSETRLIEILDAFVDGAGSNILTVTTADQGTFLAAANSPESYDLLRVRMGGWTEMFVAMHATHQKVHPRRPYST
jgi:Dyp-type peroxidase family